MRAALALPPSPPDRGRRRRPAIAVLPALVAGFTLLGCSQAIDPQAIEDAQTAVRVKTVLVNDAALGQRPIEVRVTRGVARLTGVVQSEDEARRAVELTERVTGVVDVQSALEVRPAEPPGAPAISPGGPPPDVEPFPEDAALAEALLDAVDAPGFLAIGVSTGARLAPDESLRSSWTLGPLVRLGAGSGLGFTLGFSWFDADLRSRIAGDDPIGRVRIRPVMAGVGYTARRGRRAVSLSLVGGVALNGFNLEEPGLDRRVAVSVDNSLAVRPGVSFWYDASRRIALNLFVGYVVTRPRVTYLENGRLDKSVLRSDTALVNAGIAYKVF